MGFVTMPDNLPNWAWYHDNNTLLVYMRLYFGAVWRDTEYQNVILQRGQIATTLPKITEENGITIQQARTVLDCLKLTGKITVIKTSKFSIITVLDYDCARENNSQITVEQQSNNSPSLLNTNIQTNKQPNNAHAREGGGVDKLDCESSFERFWAAYPKKTAKQQALKAWRKLEPDKALIDVILSSLEQQKQSVQWTKDNGQYIPYPATWLNGKRWEDKLPELLPKSGNTSSFDVDEIMRRSRKKYEGSSSMFESSFDINEVMEDIIRSYQDPETDKEKNT